MKATLTFVRREQKTSQAGKPFTSLSIKCNEYGEKYLSGFGNKDNAGWAVGQTVEIEVEKKQVGDKEYLNFTTPKTSGGMSQDDKDMLQKIYREVYACRQAIVMLNQIFQEKGMLPKSDYPESNGATAFDDPEDAGITEEDLPF